MTYKQTIDYLYSRLPVFHRIGAAALKPGLDNIINLCNRINNPQHSFRTIHIAGTNGKGSTSHYLASILQSAGYKTGLYTSPHVKDFRERIRINGKKVSEGYVVNFVEEKMPLFDGIDSSFFELTVALAFNYFADKKIDVAIVETGLGGRLDSTNIITPDLSVITNIGFDHMDLLGNTLPQIAFEKAGIIKNGVPVVIGEKHKETADVFKVKANTESAPLVFASDNYKITPINSPIGTLKIIATNKILLTEKTYRSELTGNYQLKNIATVLATIDELRKLGYNISEKAVKQGLANVVSQTGLLGRWHVLQQKPFVVADTAHNYDGLKETMAQLKQLNYNVLHIVLGVVADKDLGKVLPLMPKKARYYFCKPNLMRGLEADKLQQISLTYGLKGSVFLSCKKAYVEALKSATPNDVIYIGGSTFVVGEII